MASRLLISLLTFTALAQQVSAQILTCRRTAGPANSMTLHWTVPAGAVLPVNYDLQATNNLAAGVFVNVALNVVSPHVEAGLFPCPRFYRIVATDFAGTVTVSNVAGYTLYPCGGGAGGVYTPFGIKFITWDIPLTGIPTYGVVSNRPSDIVVDQANCGTIVTADRVVNQCTGTFAYRNSAAACTWTGTLETSNGMFYECCYWYLNRTGVARDLVIFGEADITTLAAAVPIPGLSYKPYNWREPRIRPRNNLQLINDGFVGGTVTTSDRVIEQCSGTFFWFRVVDNSWQGALTVIDPCQCCHWIQNRHAATWTYSYDPTSNLP